MKNFSKSLSPFFSLLVRLMSHVNCCQQFFYSIRVMVDKWRTILTLSVEDFRADQFIDSMSSLPILLLLVIEDFIRLLLGQP